MRLMDNLEPILMHEDKLTEEGDQIEWFYILDIGYLEYVEDIG